jgi:putative thioredoxin
METIIGAESTNGSGSQGELVKEVGQQDFAAEVIEASLQTPIIVDFWAPWCGPCKQLGPMLEKAVSEAAGAVRMVKVNVDENQQLAQQLRIMSIPTVYGFFQGQPVDGFQGAQPESTVKDFVKRLAAAAGASIGPSPVEQALDQAEALLEEGSTGQAEALFGQVLQHEADNRRALAGLAACHLAEGKSEEAREFVDALDEETRAAPEFASILAQLKLAETAAQAGPIGELQAKVEADPKDHQARYDLAIALQAAGRDEEAADQLLEIIRRERAWNDEAARKQLLTFFEAWGATDPRTIDARRRLSSILFS